MTNLLTTMCDRPTTVLFGQFFIIVVSGHIQIYLSSFKYFVTINILQNKLQAGSK